MARPSNTVNLNIAQLQRALDDKKSELQKLHRQRSELQKKVSGIDRQIERIEGGMAGARKSSGGGSTGSGRARNAQNLGDAMEAVMRDGGKALGVTEIMEGVLASGYRSGSDNFRGIINQTLIKDKRFGSVSRGVYELKSGGKKEKAAKAE